MKCVSTIAKCKVCPDKPELKYWNEGAGNYDRYYCPHCLTIHFWNGRKLIKTSEHVPKCKQESENESYPDEFYDQEAIKSSDDQARHCIG